MQDDEDFEKLLEDSEEMQRLVFGETVHDEPTFDHLWICINLERIYSSES